jgi:hypothetical protein
MVNVTTRSYANIRDGVNDQETRLTSEYVQKHGVRRLGSLKLGDLRGAEAQPLVMSGITMRDGLKHNVAFVCDMSNNVFAFDLNITNYDVPPDSVQFPTLWQQHLGRPVTATKQLDMWGVNNFFGILSTPVINPATMTIHLVSLSSSDGTIANSVYRFHSLSLIDGSDRAPPLVLNGATYGKFKLGTVARKQRSALLFDSRNGHDTVFFAFGSFAESASTNQGWVLAIDVTGMKPTIAATWVTGTKWPASGIWMAGQGLSMDDDGFLYGMTGNGGFDPPTDFGECFFKLKFTPETAASPAKLECVDWWSPYTDTGRAGKDQTLPSMTAMGIMDMAMGPEDHVPNNAMNAMYEAGLMTMEDMPGMANMVLGPPTNKRNLIGDQDLGSGGPLPLPKSVTGYSKSCIIGGGKDGIGYVVNMDDMGKTMPGDFAPSKIAGNYAKLMSPPIALTFNGVGMDLAPTDLTQLPVMPGGKTAHIHGAPVAYKTPDHGFVMYVGGENQPVRAFKLNPDFTLTYLACSTQVASEGYKGSGMPGTLMSISCSGQGTNTGILWCLMPYNGDANRSIVQGRLVALGANWVDQNGNLITLWDSLEWGVFFYHNKFMPPVDAGGLVLVATYGGTIDVFG